MCVLGGHACWGACVVQGVGGMRGPGGMHGPHTPPPRPDTMRYGRSMSGRYASYWNAFLLEYYINCCFHEDTRM